MDCGIENDGLASDAVILVTRKVKPIILLPTRRESVGLATV